MELADASWLAAAIDGEGSVILNRRSRRVRLILVNTNRPFVEKAASLMEAHIYINDNPNSIAGNRAKTIFIAEIAAHHTVLRVLKDILRFLIIKRQKAEDVIAFILETRWGREWSDEDRRKQSKTALDSWGNSEHRKLMSKVHLDLWKDPEYRAQQLESRKRSWANPNTRVERVRKTAETKKLTGETEKSHIRAKIRWADPAFRAKTVAAMQGAKRRRDQKP